MRTCRVDLSVECGCIPGDEKRMHTCEPVDEVFVWQCIVGMRVSRLNIVFKWNG